MRAAPRGTLVSLSDGGSAICSWTTSTQWRRRSKSPGTVAISTDELAFYIGAANTLPSRRIASRKTVPNAARLSAYKSVGETYGDILKEEELPVQTITAFEEKSEDSPLLSWDEFTFGRVEKSTDKVIFTYSDLIPSSQPIVNN